MKPYERPLTMKQGEWLRSKYRKAFPSMRGLDYNNEESTQRQGVDLYVNFNDLKPIKVDEKARWQYYGDILLEDWSIFEIKKPGWTRDTSKITDCIAYFFPEQEIFYMIHYPSLRDWFYEHYDTVLMEIRQKRIKAWGKEKEYAMGETLGQLGNANYHTANIPVNINDFEPDWLAKNFWAY
jgi:hypothetical protein